MTNNSIPIDPEKLVLTNNQKVKLTDEVCAKYKVMWEEMINGKLSPTNLEQCVIDIYDKTSEETVKAVLSSPILSAYIDKQVKEAAKEIEEEYRAYAKEWAILGSLEIIDQKVKEAREQSQARIKELEEILGERCQTILDHINNPNHLVHMRAKQEAREQERREIGVWLDRTIKIDDLAVLKTRPDLFELVNGIVSLRDGQSLKGQEK